EERLGLAEGPRTRVDLQTQSLKGVEPEQGAVPGSSEHDPRRAPQSLALQDGLSDRSVDLPSVRQPKRSDLGRLNAHAGRDVFRDPRERGPGVDDEVTDLVSGHVDRIQDDPGMRDSHRRRSHSAPSSGLSIHLHCHRQTSTSAESHACQKRWARHRSMPRRPLLAPSLGIGRGETDSRGTALRPAMSERDGPGLDGIFRRAFAEALGGRPGSSRPASEGFLWIASALLLGTNLLLVLAVFVNLIGGLGPVNPSRILWAALGMDLVGVALLGWIFWDSARPIEGRMRIVRRIVALLLFLWVGLTAFWRFVLPAI